MMMLQVLLLKIEVLIFGGDFVQIFVRLLVF